ncbi:MAG: DUF3823 domain-containing protein [Bacteroidota bacterium]
MKRILNHIALGLLMITAASCTKTDDYKGPDQTLQGTISDVATGQNVQGEVGDGANSNRIKLLEISYSANPTPQYLGVMQDGTYNNTKIFAATYKIDAEGPFVPQVQTTPVVDQSQTLEVKGGNTTVNFKVEPLLRVDWVGTPVLNANGTITVQVKMSRGTTNALFQNNITDIALFVNTSQYVGNNINDASRTARTSYTGNAANAVLGTTLTLTTVGGALPASRDYYVRVGARTDYGLKQYNYTGVLKVVVP